MHREVIISVTGLNISGIVAKVCRAIYDSRGNFEDSSMILLENHFSLMVLVTLQDRDSYDVLADACNRLVEEMGLKINIFPIDDKSSGFWPDASGPNYEIRAKGKDRMGIMYRASHLLASMGVNILELETKIVEAKDGTSMFSLRTAVAVPENIDDETLRKNLKLLAENNFETISLIPI